MREKYPLMGNWPDLNATMAYADKNEINKGNHPQDENCNPPSYGKLVLKKVDKPIKWKKNTRINQKTRRKGFL